MGSIDCIEYGIASCAIPGEFCSGDHYVVERHYVGATVSAIDGLGHGAEARKAALLAGETIARFSAEHPVKLVTRCHEALLKTRGVALSLASIDAARNCMTWIGVGNVYGVLQRKEPGSPLRYETLLQRGGVVGFRIPVLRATELPIFVGDVVVLATDGLFTRFSAQMMDIGDPQQAANEILSRFWNKKDDALVVVARYRGGSA